MALMQMLLAALAVQMTACGVLLLVGVRAAGRAQGARERIQPHLGVDTPVLRSRRDRFDALVARLGGLGLSTAEQAGLAWTLRHRRLDPADALLRHGRMRLSACLGSAGLTLAVAAVAAHYLPAFAQTLFMTPLLVGAAAWAILGLRVSRAVKARAADISRGMSDALELLLICMGSGLALEQGLARVAAEVRSRQPDLAAELELTISDLQVMSDPQSAFRGLARRVPSKSIDAIVGILCQSLEYGSPLATALREVIDHTRKSELLALEEQASKFPSLVTLPTLIFIFPALLILLIGPAALNLISSLGTI